MDVMLRFTKQSLRFLFIVVCLGLTGQAVAQAQSEEDFAQWLEALRQEAIDKGIRPEIVDRALSEAKYKEQVVASDRAQAEFKETYQDYIDKRVGTWRVEQGKLYMSAYGDAVAQVSEQHYGVPARFVVAVIGVETNYGGFALTHSLFEVLSTLAYDPRRSERFRKEIFAALTMLNEGYATHDQLKSSWAGALGVPQFMPSTYLEFAVDFDKDGRIDIWNHGPDLYASVANYLSHYGWNDDYTWARKVLLPAGEQARLESDTQNRAATPKACQRYSKHLEGWRILPEWNDAGVRRMTGKDLPDVALPASLIVTHPEHGHGYLVYENFCVLMRYNPSFKYALSVGVLADKLK